MCKNKFTCSLRMDGCRAIHEETYMMILLFSVLNDEQRALVERIFHRHHIHFQRISFQLCEVRGSRRGCRVHCIYKNHGQHRKNF